MARRRTPMTLALAAAPLMPAAGALAQDEADGTGPEVATTDQAVVEGTMAAVGADASETGDSEPDT